MARETDKLTDVQIRNAQPKDKTYKLSDGEGLYIEVRSNGGKYWRMKYRFGGKYKYLSFGVYLDTPKKAQHISLKQARAKRDEAREAISNGIDPAERKRQEKLTSNISSANSFEAIAKEWLEKETPHWSSKYTENVSRYIDNYMTPYIGKRPIKEITAPELLAVLRRKESQGYIETANRMKQIAGQIFRYGIATGRAERDPSRDLVGALAKPKEKHLASITKPSEVKVLLNAIDSFQGSKVVEVALKLSPLLFVRPTELRHMEWDELDLDDGLWSIPAEKMKLREPHLVPLCTQAIALLEEIQPLTGRGKYVFPNARGPSRPLSDNGVRVALRTLGFTNEQMTPHGFRAMARTILDEVLSFRVDWIEHQLAHAVKDSNGRAYNRTTHIDDRKGMMQTWADYLDSLKNDDNVIVANFKHRA